MEYGHYAIDITNGEGATIHSPISGTVTDRFTDDVGNPVLVITNGRYTVTLLHGDYTVIEGQRVRMGDPVGTEANHGRSSQPHTHIDVELDGEKVDPLAQGKGLFGEIMLDSTKPLRISWYDPALGGINCDSDCSTMANGEKVTRDDYGRTAACIEGWMGRTVVIDSIGSFQCADRGGAIVETGSYIWIDLMLEQPAVPFGTLVYDWYLE